MELKRNIRKTIELGVSATIIVTLLAGCFGSGSGTATSGGTPLVVTPALGQVYGGQVTVTGNNGTVRSYAIVSGVPTVTADISGMTAPLLIALTGDPANGNQLVFFDEGLGRITSSVVSTAASAVRAIVPSVTGLPASGVGVTPVTEVAAATVANASGFVDVTTLSVASAVGANTAGLALAKQLAGTSSAVIGNLLAPPTPVASNATALSGSQGDVFAKVLHTLARLSASYGKDAFEKARKMADSVAQSQVLPSTFNADVLTAALAVPAANSTAFAAAPQFNADFKLIMNGSANWIAASVSGVPTNVQDQQVAQQAYAPGAFNAAQGSAALPPQAMAAAIAQMKANADAARSQIIQAGLASITPGAAASSGQVCVATANVQGVSVTAGCYTNLTPSFTCSNAGITGAGGSLPTAAGGATFSFGLSAACPANTLVSFDVSKFVNGVSAAAGGATAGGTGGGTTGGTFTCAAGYVVAPASPTGCALAGGGTTTGGTAGGTTTGGAAGSLTLTLAQTVGSASFKVTNNAISGAAIYEIDCATAPGVTIISLNGNVGKLPLAASSWSPFNTDANGLTQIPAVVANTTYYCKVAAFSGPASAQATASSTYTLIAQSAEVSITTAASTGTGGATVPPVVVVAPTVTPGSKFGGAVMGPLTLAGTVTPVTVTPALTFNAQQLVTDGANLYVFSTGTSGSGVYKINQTTGATSLLVATTGNFNGLTSDGANVFVDSSGAVGGIGAGGIYQITPTGTVTLLLAPSFVGGSSYTSFGNFSTKGGMAVAGGKLYIAVSNRIYKLDLATNAVSIHSFGANACPTGVVCDGVGTNTASAFSGATLGNISVMTSDGTYLYGLEASKAHPGIVRQISIADGSVKTIGGTAGLNSMNSWMMGTGITTDGAGNVYVVNQAASQIIKYSIATGTSSVVATGSVAGTGCATGGTCTGFWGGVTTDGTNLYTVDAGTLVKIQ